MHCCLVFLMSLALTESGADRARGAVVLLDGSEVKGPIAVLDPDRLRLEDEKNPRSFSEIRELRFAEPSRIDSPENQPRLSERAFLLFNGGEGLPGKLLGSDGKSLGIMARGEKTEAEPSGEPLGEIQIPLSAARGFRLREALGTDPVFEETLAKTPPVKDLIFIRQGDHLIKLEGVFRGLDENDLILEHEGQNRRLKRNLVLGVVLSHVAKSELESGYEGTLWLAGGGRLPALIEGLEPGASRSEPSLRVKVRGASWKVPLRHVLRVTFATDRLQFLSDLQPAKVEETPYFDNLFPFRKDAAVSGGTLKLRGVEYRKGLGVHSRSILEFQLTGEFETFIARVGIDDACGLRGSASIRVLGDDRELFKGDVSGGESPLEIAVSMAGTKVLRLETDYGSDGLDLSDHVDWAEARLVKTAGTNP